MLGVLGRRLGERQGVSKYGATTSRGREKGLERREGNTYGRKRGPGYGDGVGGQGKGRGEMWEARV